MFNQSRIISWAIWYIPDYDGINYRKRYIIYFVIGEGMVR